MELARVVAETPIARRIEHRLALGRFYLAHDLPANALGTIEAGVADELQSGDDAGLAMLHGLAELDLGRYDAALRDLSKTSLAGSAEAALLRASTLMHLAQFPEARDQFALGRVGLTGLPIELQRIVLLDGLRAAIEVSDFAEATRIRNDFETIGVSPKQQPMLSLLSARLAHGVGKTDQAASELAQVAQDDNGPAAAEARLRLIEMRYGRGDLDRIKAITALESLSFAWRGNITELETLRFLARLYVQEARYREAFRQLDAALLSKPGSEITRSFQAEMAVVFEDLFLSDKGASLAPIDALAIYYDFSKLTPIGRRGDELIRRLAERLVGVDLLDQAAELLDHQVEFRLSGAAKAQVAAKLAMVQLMNRKPAEAIRVLAGSRSRELSQELREQRLLLESRAMSETGRHDAALDIVANLVSDEAARLRADILWNAKRWAEAGEAIERLLGDRWKGEAALDDIARRDVLRAGIAYALGNEAIGLGRLRERYATKMEGADRTAFNAIASGPTNPKAVAEVAKTMSAIDSLDLFIRLYRARFGDKPLPEGSPSAALATR
jgi:tetratricopeptide (TPR) repeat protein